LHGGWRAEAAFGIDELGRGHVVRTTQTTRFLTVTVAVILLSGSLGHASEISGTHPTHITSSKSQLDGGYGTPPKQPSYPNARGQVIVKSPDPLRKAWEVSAALSKACSRGTFRQRRPHGLVALMNGRKYGAGVGGQSSLVDTQKLAKPQIIYVFTGQGTTDCRVYHRME